MVIDHHRGTLIKLNAMFSTDAARFALARAGGNRNVAVTESFDREFNAAAWKGRTIWPGRWTGCDPPSGPGGGQLSGAKVATPSRKRQPPLREPLTDHLCEPIPRTETGVTAAARITGQLGCPTGRAYCQFCRENSGLKEVHLSHGLANLVTDLINASVQSDDGEFEGIALGMQGFQTQCRRQRRQGSRS